MPKFTFKGTTIGNILTLSLSGFMCESGVDGGWPLLFYVFGKFLLQNTFKHIGIHTYSFCKNSQIHCFHYIHPQIRN